MNETNGFDLTSPVAREILLRMELDFGLEMAEVALINRQFGSWEEYEQLKVHAADALASCVATANHLGTVDQGVVIQFHELAFRVAVL